MAAARVFRVEFRIAVAQRILNGESVSSLSSQYKIKRSVLYRWRDAYREKGRAGFGRVKSELLRLSPGSGRYSFPLSKGTREMSMIRKPNLGSDLCNRQIARSQVILCTAQTLVQKITIWRLASSGFEQPSEVEWAQSHNRCDLRR